MLEAVGHVRRQIVHRLPPVGEGVLLLAKLGDGFALLVGVDHRSRIDASVAVAVRVLDVGFGPLPALALAHLGGDPLQLVQDQPVQKCHVFRPPRAMFGE